MKMKYQFTREQYVEIQVARKANRDKKTDNLRPKQIRAWYSAIIIKATYGSQSSEQFRIPQTVGYLIVVHYANYATGSCCISVSD